MATYDDQNIKTRPERLEEDDLRNITGISPDEESKMEDSAYSGAAEDIAEKNNLGIDNDSSQSNKQEPIKNNSDIKTNSLNKKGLRSSIRNKKSAIGAFLVATIISGIMSILTLITGPLQILHVSKFIDLNFFKRNNETMDISTRRLYNTLAGQRERNRLGALASTLTQRNVNKLKTSGIDLSFNTANGKGRSKLQAITIDTSTDQGKSLLGRVQAEGIDLPSPDIDGKITLRAELRGNEGGSLMRSMADHMIELNGKKGISGAIAKRRMKKLFGADFHPSSIARRQGENIIDTIKRGHTERAEKARTGTKSNFTDPSSHTDPETGVDTPVDAEVDQESKVAKELVEDIKGQSKSSKLKAIRGSKLLKVGAAGTAAVSVVCTVKEIGDNVAEYKMLNIIKPLIRLSTDFLANGSKLQSMQDLDMT
ncbi:hypothetical protein KC867_01730, partial [Candidatus Saccharibacteria bacterium]|nr:hypothetical protein [Candidatus Saccharibacteria bacterium]